MESKRGYVGGCMNRRSRTVVVSEWVGLSTDPVYRESNPGNLPPVTAGIVTTRLYMITETIRTVVIHATNAIAMGEKQNI